MMRFLRTLALVAVYTSGVSAHAALSFGSFPSEDLGREIPDGNRNGYANVINVSGMESSLASVTVGLQVSGGWNGDLYAYLSHGDSLVVLLNRVGRVSDSTSPFGYNDGGLKITLGASGTDIHDYRTIQNYASAIQNATFVWSADGRKTDPDAVRFDSPRDTTLANFNGMDPNGAWTLFFADVSGGGTSHLENWSLNIEAVPEPVTVSLAILGAIFGCSRLVRYLKSGRRRDNLT